MKLWRVRRERPPEPPSWCLCSAHPHPGICTRCEAAGLGRFAVPVPPQPRCRCGATLRCKNVSGNWVTSEARCADCERRLASWERDGATERRHETERIGLGK